uniref:Putative conserved secreted protein n=1 Tax=Phlebotomus kandelakii TaxID=1109342 RepID=A0A6B2EB59_9DIPT
MKKQQRVFFVCFVMLTVLVKHSSPATIWKDTATPKPTDAVNEDVLELAHLKSITSHGEAKDFPSLEQQLNALEDTKKHRGQPEEANEVSNDVTPADEEEKPLEFESDIKPLLKNSHGQYSAFDMAQYVFWTGDEAGVARAIEELIHENLISREKAIKLLSEIKMEIEYLQKAYGSRGLTRAPPTTTSTPIPTTTVAEEESKSQFLSRLRTMATSGQYGSILESNAVDYDEAAGRLRLADFLYAEYSLEEIIYQLAKVMFSQSLTKGSEHAHIALQRLTEFLESEGNYGRISPSLQKKVLDVLLAALSDTLADVQNAHHPSHKEQTHK